MKMILRILSLALFASLSGVYAQLLVIPQVADGGGWATTIVLTNTSATVQTVALSFNKSVGAGATAVWTPPFKETVTLSSLNLPAGATLFLHTPGTALTLTQGWGQLTAAASVVGYAIFTSHAPGNPAQDATAPAVAASSRILVPFDNTSHLITAAALVNPNATQETVLVNIRTSDGTVTTGSANLPANGQETFLMPTQFPATAGKSGLAEFYTNTGTISAIALRANPSGAFTTAPVYPESGAPIINVSPVGINFARFAPRHLVPAPAVQLIPQVADGAGWASTIVLVNTSSSTQIVSLTFNQSTSGGATSPWNPPFKESVTLTNLSLPPGSALFLHTPGAAASLTEGWGKLQGDPSVLGYAIFTSAAPGNPAQDATAPAGAAPTRILAPFDNTSGFIAAFAVANPNAAAETISVNIRNSDGTTSTSTLPNLPGNGQITFLMPTQFPGTAGKSGLAEFFVSSGSFSIIELRANPSGAFTAAPVYSESGSPIISTGGGGGNGGGGGGGGSSNTNPTPAEILAWIARGYYSSGNIGFIRTTAYATTDSIGAGGVTPVTTTTKTDTFTAQFSKVSGTDLAKFLNNQLPLGYPNPAVGSCVVYNLSAVINLPIPSLTYLGLDAGPQITSMGPNGTQNATRETVPSIGFSYSAGSLPNTYIGAGHYTVTGPGGADVGIFSGGLDIAQDFVITDNPAAFSVINRAGGVTVHWTGGEPTGLTTIEGASFAFDINNPNATPTGAGFVCYQNTSAGQFAVPGSVLTQLAASQTLSAGGFSLVTRGSLSVHAGGIGARFATPTGLDILTAVNGWLWSFTPQYQ